MALGTRPYDTWISANVKHLVGNSLPRHEYDLQQQIVNTMNRLRPVEHPLYRRYVLASFRGSSDVLTMSRYMRANDSRGVFVALRESFPPGSLDELIRFSDINIANLALFDGITTLSYAPGDDLVQLAKFVEKRRPPVYRDPKAAAAKTEIAGGTQGGGNRFDALAAHVETGVDEDEEIRGPAVAPVMGEAADPSLKITEEMLSAAERLLKIYRQRTTGTKKNKIDKSFITCFNLQKTRTGWNANYRKVCLWRLPFTLDALKRLNRIHDAKKKAYKDLKSADHLKIDEINARLTLAAYVSPVISKAHFWLTFSQDRYTNAICNSTRSSSLMPTFIVRAASKSLKIL
jgi:hypothetical protein